MGRGQVLAVASPVEVPRDPQARPHARSNPSPSLSLSLCQAYSFAMGSWPKNGLLDMNKGLNLQHIGRPHSGIGECCTSRGPCRAGCQGSQVGGGGASL